jgi:hypothetical protein
MDFSKKVEYQIICIPIPTFKTSNLKYLVFSSSFKLLSILYRCVLISPIFTISIHKIQAISNLNILYIY